MWSDSEGNLWMFGGYNINLDSKNDLWKFEPDYNCIGDTVCCTLDVDLRISHGDSGSVNIMVLDETTGLEYSIDGGETWSEETFFNLPVGVYLVVVRDEFGCQFSELVEILEIQVHTNDLNNNSLLRIYPNPASELLEVEWTEPYALNIQCQIISIDGRHSRKSQMTWDGQIHRTKFYVADLENGTYHLILRNSNGEYLTSRKIEVIKS